MPCLQSSQAFRDRLELLALGRQLLDSGLRQPLLMLKLLQPPLQRRHSLLDLLLAVLSGSQSLIGLLKVLLDTLILQGNRLQLAFPLLLA